MSDVTDGDLGEFRTIDETADLRRQVADLQIKLKRSRTKTADLVEAVRQGSRDAAVAIGNPSPPTVPKSDRRTKRAEIALLPVSDWHVGKRTSSFDSEVAERRIQLLASKVDEITEIERADHPVNECHVLLCGDFTDGVMVFPGQSFEIDSTLFAQLFKAATVLEGLLTQMLETFPNVTVWAQTGNHGRIGRKGDMPRGDNTDRLLYRIVRERLAGESRITWHEPESWYTIVEIGDYRGLLIHGDQIKSFGGNTPAFGILRKCNSWASGVLPPFQDVWMGHFHQPLVLPLANGSGRVFVSPSIESDSDYAREFVAATGTPSQRLCFIDPVKGRVTAERLLWLS
jgi:hypothetical protein